MTVSKCDKATDLSTRYSDTGMATGHRRGTDCCLDCVLSRRFRHSCRSIYHATGPSGGVDGADFQFRCDGAGRR